MFKYMNMGTKIMERIAHFELLLVMNKFVKMTTTTNRAMRIGAGRPTPFRSSLPLTAIRVPIFYRSGHILSNTGYNHSHN